MPALAAVPQDSPEPEPARHSFEVATIRPAAPNPVFLGMRIAPSGRVTISSMVLVDLVRLAYLHYSSEAKITGGPGWAGADRFDITAKVDETDMSGWNQLSELQRVDRVRPMLRQLLTDRFHLKIHTETRPTQVYAVIQSKHGSKLVEVPPPPAILDAAETGDAASQKGAKPPRGVMKRTADGWLASAVRVPNILWLFAQHGYADQPLVDETGLNGYYDFNLKLAPEKDGLSFDQQVEDGLGLRVVQRKIPYSTYVIDSADKPTLDGATP